mgnify:CR=1 FL=1
MGESCVAASFTSRTVALRSHGLAWGLRGPQMAAIRADYFGRTHFATILGVSNALIIIGTISGPVIAGYVYDVTNSYRIGFIIVAALAAAGGVCRRPRRCAALRGLYAQARRSA